MSYKEEFISLFEENVNRQGAKDLLDWMEKTDNFTEPASTKYKK